MATTTPFVHVSVNRFGFNILDVRINLAGTEEPRKMAMAMVFMACGITDPEEQQDNMQWLDDQYTQAITNHETFKQENAPFYLEDDLITFRYVQQHDKY